MLDESPKKRGSSSARAWKFLAASCCGLLLAFGLCGLDAHLYPHAEFGGSALAGFGAILLALSGLTLISSLLAIVYRAIYDLFKR